MTTPTQAQAQALLDEGWRPIGGRRHCQVGRLPVGKTALEALASVGHPTKGLNENSATWTWLHNYAAIKAGCNTEVSPGVWLAMSEGIGR